MEHTERFSVGTRVIHGNFLSPILFNVVLQFVLSSLKNIDYDLVSLGCKLLKDLDYADVIYLFTKDINEVKFMTEFFVAEASQLILTKLMKNRKTDTRCIKIDNPDLRGVEKFKYLDCEIN